MNTNHKALENLVSLIFQSSGSSIEEAEKISNHLILSNLVGHDSHGIIRVPRYIMWLKEGKVNANVKPEIVNDGENIILINGKGGFGQVVGHFATNLGIQRSRENGCAIIAIKNSAHLGRIGHWAEIAALEGIISIHFVNTSGLGLLVAPFGSYERRFSTNPFAAGIPVPNSKPFLLDFATSVVAEGKMQVALQGGKPLPEDSLIDKFGQFTNDPRVVYGNVGNNPLDQRSGKGAIRPMGDHKGSGLSFLCELLGGALTGGGAGKLGETKLRNGMLSIFIKPESVTETDSYQNELKRYLDFFKSAKPAIPGDEVLMPGELEEKTKETRIKQGIQIPEKTWQQLLIIAKNLKIDQKEINKCII